MSDARESPTASPRPMRRTHRHSNGSTSPPRTPRLWSLVAVSSTTTTIHMAALTSPG